jgi:hypothetical protein
MSSKLLPFPSKRDNSETSYIETWLPLEAASADGYKLVEDIDRVFQFGCWAWVKLGDIALSGYHSLYTPLGYIIRFIDWQTDGRILVRPFLPDEGEVLYRQDEIEIEGRVIEVLSDLEDPYCERWVLTRRKASTKNFYLRPVRNIKI